MYETEKENSIHFYLQNHLIFDSVKQKQKHSSVLLLLMKYITFSNLSSSPARGISSPLIA